MIIAIDGPSGSGKSTIAKRIAKGFKFLFISSGAVYRALSYFVLKQSYDDSALEALRAQDCSRLTFKVESMQLMIEFDGQSIMENLNNQEIANKASSIAKLKNIREIVSKLIRTLGVENDCVVEGRDISTVVFKDAFLKIYLSADLKTRAKRRFDEYEQKQDSLLKLEDLMTQIRFRDEEDENRKNSPLKKAVDAIEIDTSKLSLDRVVQSIIAQYKKKVKQSTKGLAKILKQSRARLFYRLFQNICYYWFRLFYKLEVHGVENFLNCKGGAILASNHTSYFDPPILGASCPNEIFFLAQDYLFKVPVLSTLIRKLNSYPVKGANQSDFFVLKQIISILKDDKKVVVFPEGSRSLDGKFTEFKQGVALLSVQSNASILPIYINGAHAVWPRGRGFFKLFGHFCVFFGREIKPESFAGVEKKEARVLIMNQLYKEMSLLKERFQFIN